eukprot:TRINITY_DN65122_c0_g1_i2.p1 TRINITY_DN65122_c0_g1~~TRINITY_DN65122_c0_g1_i2.p1  ORF type:complete len:204 (+),score=10.17 TRINITY_DN65122_c0_g1_i2:79-690(+)
MRSHGLVLTWVASSVSWSYAARRNLEIDVGVKNNDTLGEEEHHVETSFKRLVRGFSYVGSLLQQGVAVNASAPSESYSSAQIEVSDACMEKVKAASVHCVSGTSFWAFSCMPPFSEADPNLSFPLDEVCLADVRKHSVVKDAKTGCCRNDSSGECCRQTKTAFTIMMLLVIFPALCFCFCCCALGWAVAIVVMRCYSRAPRNS